MKLQIKRIYDEPEFSDGRRIYVDRLWARGLTKEKARLDAWVKDVAPSTELRKWYGHKVERFAEFKQHYTDELNSNPEAADFLRKIKNYPTVTLLYSAKDGDHSNAAVLLDWLKDQL